MAHKSEKSGKRFIRCTNYDDCGVSYPLPARGKLSATGEVCEHCGAPVVVVETARGPWRICVNMDCPGKEKKPVRRQGRDEAGAEEDGFDGQEDHCQEDHCQEGDCEEDDGEEGCRREDRDREGVKHEFSRPVHNG